MDIWDTVPLLHSTVCDDRNDGIQHELHPIIKCPFIKWSVVLCQLDASVLETCLIPGSWLADLAHSHHEQNEGENEPRVWGVAEHLSKPCREIILQGLLDHVEHAVLPTKTEKGAGTCFEEIMYWFIFMNYLVQKGLTEMHMRLISQTTSAHNKQSINITTRKTVTPQIFSVKQKRMKLDILQQIILQQKHETDITYVLFEHNGAQAKMTHMVW